MEQRIFDLVKSGVIVSPSILNRTLETEMAESLGDEVFMEASQMYESSAKSEASQLPYEIGRVRHSHFGKPVSNSSVEEDREAGVPVKTKQATTWASNVWKSWVKHRMEVGFVEE